jgi:hypothetical protein
MGCVQLATAALAFGAIVLTMFPPFSVNQTRMKDLSRYRSHANTISLFVRFIYFRSCPGFSTVVDAVPPGRAKNIVAT